MNAKKITTGTKLRIVEKWCDSAFDRTIIWEAKEDEDGGRVLIQATNLPGMKIQPTERVTTDMVEVIDA